MKKREAFFAFLFCKKTPDRYILSGDYMFASFIIEKLSFGNDQSVVAVVTLVNNAGVL